MGFQKDRKIGYPTFDGAQASPDNGYRKALREWDSRIGDSRVQAKNWRFAAMGFGLLSFVLAVNLGFAINNTQVKVFVAPVDGSGNVGEVRLLEGSYSPTKAQIAKTLIDFVKNTRTKSIDPVVTKTWWNEAYMFLGPEAKSYLNTWARQNDPTADIGEKTRSVEIRNVIQRSEDTYQATWFEKSYHKGNFTGKKAYTGIFTVGVTKPSEEEARVNPLGIVIKTMTWDQEYENVE